MPGWWIGGKFGDRLKKKWAVTIDLTCEFPEACREVTGEYLLLPCWDGVPPTPAQIVMKGGDVVEAGLTDRVLDDPQAPYTQLLVSSILQV